MTHLLSYFSFVLILISVLILALILARILALILILTLILLRRRLSLRLFLVAVSTIIAIVMGASAAQSLLIMSLKSVDSFMAFIALDSFFPIFLAGGGRIPGPAQEVDERYHSRFRTCARSQRCQRTTKGHPV